MVAVKVDVQVSASVLKIALLNPRPNLFVFVIKLLLDAVTLFVSRSLFVLVAEILWVFTTAMVGLLLLMSSMVTFVFGDLGESVTYGKCDADTIKKEAVGLRTQAIYCWDDLMVEVRGSENGRSS